MIHLSLIDALNHWLLIEELWINKFWLNLPIFDNFTDVAVLMRIPPILPLCVNISNYVVFVGFHQVCNLLLILTNFGSQELFWWHWVVLLEWVLILFFYYDIELHSAIFPTTVKIFNFPSFKGTASFLKLSTFGGVTIHFHRFL